MQALEYVKNIESNTNIDLNLWALHNLSQLNCQSLNFVRNEIKGISSFSTQFDNYDCEGKTVEIPENGLISDFLDEDINKAVRAIQQGTSEYEDYNFSGIHNLLFNHILFENFREKILDENGTNIKLQREIKSWVQAYESGLVKDELHNAVLLGAIIRGSYIVYDNETIYKYGDDFLKMSLFPNSILKLRELSAIDYINYVYGHFDKSLAIQRQHTIPLAKFSSDEARYIRSKNRQGSYLFSLGKYEEAKRIFEELYEINEDPVNNAVLFNNIGINYLKLGHSNKYIQLQLKALDFEIGEYQYLLNIYRNLFIYYTSIKDINSALSYIDKAKSVAIEHSDTTELALIDSYLGSFYWETYKDDTKALHHFEEARKVLNPDTDYDYYVDLLTETGTIYTRIDSFKTALSTFTKLKNLAKQRSDTPNYIDGLVNELIVKLKMGYTDEVRKGIKELSIYSLDNLDFELIVKYYTLLAEFKYINGEKRQAIKELSPIVNTIIDRARNNTDSQAGYWNVQDEYLGAIELLVNIYLDSGAEKEALSLLDQLKTINDASLYNSPLVKASKLTEEQLSEEKNLSDDIQLLRKKYLNASESERFDIKREIDQLNGQRNEILSEANLDKSTPLSPIWSVQRMIRSNEVLLHFTEIENDIFISELSSTDINIRKIELNDRNTELLRSAADALASGNTDLNKLHDIYNLIDADRISRAYDKISVIPDNYLYRIPLEILPVTQPSASNSYGSARYLIEDFDISYYTSLSEFEFNRRNPDEKKPMDFAAYAISDFSYIKNQQLPSLPFATLEAQQIESTLTSFKNRKIYTGTQASKAAFKNSLSDSRIVHVATHSEVSEKDPLFSTIYLNNAGMDSLESEQALYAYELFDTPFNSDFIMLNSCSSGSGSFMQGTGIMGISRALRYAGAKSLALNLWSVNDKVAAEFATDFYRYLNQGDTKSTAVRKAKIMQLKTANANPHFWGAYMLIGNPEPMTNRASRPLLLYSVLAICTILIGVSSRRAIDEA